MHLGHNGKSCPVQRNPWEDVSMAGAEEEEEQEADLLEDFSGIMGSVMSQCTALLNQTHSGLGLVQTLASVHALCLIPTIMCLSISNSVLKFGS